MDAVIEGDHDSERDESEDDEDYSEPESETEDEQVTTFSVLNNERGGRAVWING
jgi:hypothetical protein